MKLEQALKNFVINEIRIIYKKDIYILKNPSDIKMHENEEGLIGIDCGPNNINYFVFIIVKKDIDYKDITIHK